MPRQHEDLREILGERREQTKGKRQRFPFPSQPDHGTRTEKREQTECGGIALQRLKLEMISQSARQKRDGPHPPIFPQRDPRVSHQQNRQHYG
jgi:hypothetical protein